MDQRYGVGRPASFPFTLNNAVDLLMKKEFDIHRSAKTQHPLMKTYGIDAVPYDDPRMEEWRDAMRRGISCLHKPTNLILRGGVDDIWINKAGELIVVDYKATSKDEEITLDDEWKDGYKRQMEIYQWLFKQNNFKVSDTGYFVYVNGKTDRKAFDGKLEFDVTIIPYKGNTDWIEKVIIEMKKCLDADVPPKAGDKCEFCAYRKVAGQILMDISNEQKKKKVTKSGSTLF
jgi:CRISPR/Cas system-associated exonuclease Cas4 (RecB family)